MANSMLLPRNWAHVAPQLGLNTINPNDFEGRLYNLTNIVSSGIPSILAHPYAFTKALSTTPPSNKAMQQFSLLVKALFLGILDVVSYDLAIGSKLTKVLQSFEPRINYFYVLKWKNMAVGGIYPDCFIFPGARFIMASEYEAQVSPTDPHPEPDYKGVTLQNLEKEIEKQTKLFGPDLVKALFAHWIQEIKATLHIPLGDEGPVWLQRLLDVSNTYWNTTFRAPNDNLNDFTSVFNTIQLRHKNNLVDVPLRKLSRNIFCENIIQFANGEIPDIPVKSEHLHLIDIAASSYLQDDNGIKYSIQLKGWPGQIEWSPTQVIGGDQASILLWPDFKAEGWNVDYVFFIPSPSLRGLKPSLKLIGANFVPIRNLSEMEGCQTDVPVEYVEVLLNNKPVGVFKDDRKLIGKGPGTITISLDFGTTHTSIGIKNQSTDKYELFNFKDMTHDLLGMDYFYSQDNDTIRKGCFWLPTTSFEDILNILPSEIVFKTANLLASGDKILKEPIKNFTIPHPQIERNRLHEIIVANFKWDAPENFRQNELVKTYLKMVFNMALAVLRQDYLCTNVSVVPTYPLAFGKNMYKSYKKIFSEIFAEILKETGITLSLAIVNTDRGLEELVGESYAAKAFWSSVPGTAELVVDIGGGTTDIALWANGKEFVDSFQYGANRYLEWLARKFPSHPLGIKDVSERVIALQKKMRESGIIGVLNIYPPAQRTTAQQKIDRFFEGLFEYLYRILNASGAKKLHLYPVGNGWRLIEGYFPPNDNIPDYVTSWFNRKGIEIIVILPTDKDYKGWICKGAMKIADDGCYIPPELDRAVKTIIGGPILVGGISKEWNEIVPTGPLGPPPLGFDTTPFIESLPFSPYANIDKITISGQLANHCQNATHYATGGMVELNKSIFAIFLEKIYPEYYL